jgi:hypothetical protein
MLRLTRRAGGGFTPYQAFGDKTMAKELFFGAHPEA